VTMTRALVFHFLLFFSASAGAAGSLTLELKDGRYTITNSYFVAVIPGDRVKEGARGIVTEVYIRRHDGSLSRNVVNNYNWNGLGYLEGGKMHHGLQHAPKLKVKVVENSPERVVIESSARGFNDRDWYERWTFWDGCPFFRSEAWDIEKIDRLSKQNQYAWMIRSQDYNPHDMILYFGTDELGNLRAYDNASFQYMFSRRLTSFPFINFPFEVENVALGLVFVQSSQPLEINGETDGFGYEYQVNFFGGPSEVLSPTRSGMKRSLTTVYVVSPEASSADIERVARASFRSSWPQTVQGPVWVLMDFESDVSKFSSRQHPGPGFTIYSPFFRVHQNTEAGTLTGVSQRSIRIHPPIFLKHWVTQHKSWHTYSDWIEEVNLGCISGGRELLHGKIERVSKVNRTGREAIEISTGVQGDLINARLRLIPTAEGRVLVLEGEMSCTRPSEIEDVFIDLEVNSFHEIEPVEDAVSESWVNGGSASDGRWGKKNFLFDSGHTYVYNDSLEEVPPLAFEVELAEGHLYDVFAKLLGSPSSSIEYVCKVAQESPRVVRTPVLPVDDDVCLVYLATVEGTGRRVEVEVDDSDESDYGGGWSGVDGIVVARRPTVRMISEKVLDITWRDPIYGVVGQAVRLGAGIRRVSLQSRKVRLFLDRSAFGRDPGGSLEFDLSFFAHPGEMEDESHFGLPEYGWSLEYEKRGFCRWAQSAGVHRERCDPEQHCLILEVLNNTETDIEPVFECLFGGYRLQAVEDVGSQKYLLTIDSGNSFQMGKLKPAQVETLKLYRVAPVEQKVRVNFLGGKTAVSEGWYEYKTGKAELRLSCDADGEPVSIGVAARSFTLFDNGRVAAVVRDESLVELIGAYRVEYLPVSRSVYLVLPRGNHELEIVVADR